MKKLLIIISILLIFPSILFAGVAFAKDVYVRGHWRDTDHDGIKDTYVEPYYRTAPDSNPYNNYSTTDNINPYTGKKGSQDPDDNSNKSLFSPRKSGRSLFDD